MKPLSLKTIASLCAASSAAVIAFTGVAAMAQPAPPPGAHGARGGPPPAEHRRDGDGAEHAKRLHDLLQITPAQEASFKTWLEAMKPPAHPERPGLAARGERAGRGPGPGPAGRPGEDFRNMTTPQRIDARLAMMDKRDAEMRARANATKAFYNSLSPAQQKAMDSLPPMGRHGHGDRGGKHGGPGGLRGHGGGEFGPQRGFGEPRGPGGPPPQ